VHVEHAAPMQLDEQMSQALPKHAPHIYEAKAAKAS